MNARTLTPEEHAQGFAKCDKCNVFAHVFTQAAIARLPRTYHGEMCPQCNLHMVRLDKMIDPDCAHRRTTRDASGGIVCDKCGEEITRG